MDNLLHKTLKILFILLVFSNATTLLGQNKTEKLESLLNAEAFDQQLKSSKNPQLIDVRTPEEYKKGHLKNALNVDWKSPEFNAMIEALDKKQPVYVYCLSGGRSASAVEKMKASGFTEIFELDGGIMAWEKAQKTTVKLKKSTEQQISIDDYKKMIDSEKLVLVDFNAPWCAPCKKMAPMLKEISQTEKDKVKLVKINIDDQKTLAKALDIQILPTLILYKDNQVAWKHEGYADRAQLLKVINENL